MKMTMLKLGDVLKSARLWIDLDSDIKYSPIGVRGFGRGLIVYPSVLPEELSKLRYSRLVGGALVLSNIKAWEGAVAVAPPESECIASNRFLQYVPRSDKILVEYVREFLLSKEGLRLLMKASPGSADRNRTLSIANLENLVIPLPSLADQSRVVNHLKGIESVVHEVKRRNELAEALLPSARNEIFSAMH